MERQTIRSGRGSDIEGATMLGRNPDGPHRGTTVFMKSVATAVALAFSMLILTPTVVAARDHYERERQLFARTPSSEARLGQAAVSLGALLERLDGKLARAEQASAERSELRRLRGEIATLDRSVSDGFAQVEQRLVERGLPEVVLQRHRAMVEHYRAELASLLSDLDGIDREPDEQRRRARIEATAGRLASKPFRRSQQPFEPHDLPTQTLRPDPHNKPRLSQADYADAGLFDTPWVRLAALGDFRFDHLAGADDPAYLAETTEVTLTRPIRDKAAALDHDPVRIYHWVRNHIQWQPTWGAVQNAELTLGAGRGNAFDIASLTLALLRASGIPARYVHGTIEVPQQRFRNWAGGFESVEAAADYASAGGIPIATVIEGGRLSRVQLEHIWVEAAIDYHPSRGAINREADSWVALDPSYKQYQYLDGLDAIAISGIDPESLAQRFLDSGSVNEAEGWASGFDPTILQGARQQARQRLEGYIADHFTDPTVGDVIGGARTVVQSLPVLPSGLPNRVRVRGARYAKLPGQLQQQIGYAFGRDLFGDPQDPIRFPWARLNNERVTLSFEPATPQDQQTLLALLPEGEITDASQLPGSIPAYLIQVVPQLKLNGKTLKTGNPIGLGEELELVTLVTRAGASSITRSYRVPAGAYLSLNVVAGSVSRHPPIAHHRHHRRRRRSPKALRSAAGPAKLRPRALLVASMTLFVLAAAMYNSGYGSIADAVCSTAVALLLAAVLVLLRRPARIAEITTLLR